MTVAGQEDVLEALPPIVAANWTIANPSTTLAEVRRYGSSDPTYGSIGWVPRLDASPFAVIYAEEQGTDDDQHEPNRKHVEIPITLFVALAHADIPGVREDYNALAHRWVDSARHMCAEHYRLDNAWALLGSDVGSVRWRFLKFKVNRSFKIYETPFYGVEIATTLRLVVPVAYQQP